MRCVHFVLAPSFSPFERLRRSSPRLRVVRNVRAQEKAFAARSRPRQRQMPFAKTALAAALQVLGAQAAIVWPGHVEYPLGLLDGTDGFRVTAESSTGRLGFSVAGVGVSEPRADS